MLDILNQWKWKTGAAAAASLLAAAAQGAPVTLYFEGVTTFYRDAATGAQDPAGTLGQAFSGYLTFDLSNTETTSRSTAGPTSTRSQSSDSGCGLVVNGQCDPRSDSGINPPVLTAYRIHTSFAPSDTYQKLDTPADIHDSSFVRNSLTTSNQQSIFASKQEQTQDMASGVVMEEVDDIRYLRSLSISAFTSSSSFLSNWDDLLAPRDFSQVSTDQFLLSFTDVVWRGTCGDLGCTGAYSPDSFGFGGNITSIRFIAGDAAAEVPEPPSIPLLAAGFLGCCLVRGRRHLD